MAIEQPNDGFMTLDDVFSQSGLELMTYISKQDLSENGVVFCIVDAKKIETPKSEFTPEQWLLTVLVPLTDGSTRKYWLAFAPNQTRDDFMQAIVDSLAKLPEDKRIIHACKLEAIQMKKWDNPFYALNRTSEGCSCKHS